MQRKARSRSDAPRLTEPFSTALTIFGTFVGIGCIATGIVVVGNGCTVAIITGSITIGAGVQFSVGGAGSTSSSRRATR